MVKGIRRLINKGMIMAIIECQINKLLKDIENQDYKIEDLEKKIISLDINRINVNRAYAKEIGLVVTNKNDVEIEKELMYSLIDKYGKKTEKY